MANLSLGSSGSQVVALQNQLIRLGFLDGDADGELGPVTAQALRDVQRRLLLRPDGVVGPLTRAALAAAVARHPPFPTSAYRALVQQARAEAAAGRASEEHLPILDRGLAASPWRCEPPRYAARLATRIPAAQLLPYPDPAGTFAPYPAHGVLPSILSGTGGRGGLEFLSDEVVQACLCVGSFAADRPLRVRWYGRRALEDNVQFWSATKFVAPLHLVCQANRLSPGTPIGSTLVRSLDGSRAETVATLFHDMVSYAPRAGEPDGGSSNRIAYMFKKLLNRGEPDVQSWLRALSGNDQALLMGWYGQWEPPRQATAADPAFFNPYRQGVELLGPAGVLIGQRDRPRTRNLVSAYDLVRLITMLGWHHQLSQNTRLPGAQWASLATLVEGLGHDTARYIDVALEQLGLAEAVAEPVILSKLGYGAETGDPCIDALSYVAFASFRDLRSTLPRQRCFALALRLPTRPGLDTALRHDARMAAEVTEIVRRVFAEQLT